MTLPPDLVKELDGYNNDNLHALAVTEKYETMISDVLMKRGPFMRVSINDQTIEFVAPTNDQNLIVVVTNTGVPFILKNGVIELPTPFDGVEVLHNVGMGGFVKVKLNVQFVRPFNVDDVRLVRIMKRFVDYVPPFPG